MVFPLHGGPASILRLSQQETAMHGHGFTELVIVAAGTALHAVDAEPHYTLSPGDIFVISGRSRHAYLTPHQLQLINVLIRNDFIKEHWSKLQKLRGARLLFGRKFHRPRCLSPEDMEGCLRVVERLEEELAGLKEGSVLMQNLFLMELLISLSRRVVSPAKIADSNREHISRALSFIEQHYAEDLALASMAKAARMAPRSFQRHFKSAVGMPPLKYLLRCRIANCCRLLAETNAPILGIAAECGISEPTYFCRVFRRMTGVTPGRFRSNRIESAEHPKSNPDDGGRTAV